MDPDVYGFALVMCVIVGVVAIAVEVERIADGQRFSTKLLAESARSNAGGSAMISEGR